jgi:hypothetical protein
MLIGKRINKPILQMVENAISFRQFFVLFGIPLIPVVDVGSPGHSGEAKSGCLDQRAKDLSSMKRDGMA